MRKAALIVLVIISTALSVFAVSAEELYQEALENSPQIAEMRKSRYYSFIDSIVQSSTEAGSWGLQFNGSYSITKDFTDYCVNFPSLEVYYTSPTVGNALTYELRGTLENIMYMTNLETNTKEFNPFGVSLTAGVRKSFEFKSWDDTDPMKELTERQQSLSFERYMLQFENTFLEDLIDLIKCDIDSMPLIAELENLYFDYENDIEEGRLIQGTPEDTKRLIEFEAAEKEYEQYSVTVMELAEEFKNNYGLDDWNIDSVGDYNLDFVVGEEWSFSVQEKYAQYKAAVQSYEEKTGTTSTLTLAAHITPRANMAANLQHNYNEIKGDVSATYNIGNFMLDVTMTTGYNFLKDNTTGLYYWVDPTITVSGSWSNTRQVLSDSEIANLKLQYTDAKGNLDTATYQQMLTSLTNKALKKDQLELEALQANIWAAEREFDDELEAFTRKSKELAQTIRAHRNEGELLEIRIEGNKKVLQQTKELVDKGEADTSALIEADTQCFMDEMELLCYKLKTHILSNEIKLLVL